ncbi:MAG: aminodeoxychorismate lyase [Gammaproteobacteria bacterium]|nr:aminodeoxychorismate lyase [Gammaproteobacteria bacterium]
MAVPSPQVLVDGVAEGGIPAHDRGFAYGDGVFRTIRVDQGRLWLWPDHLAKLTSDARKLGLPLQAADHALLENEARQLTDRASGTLRLVLTRGSGPRGDRPPRPAALRRVLLFYPGATPVIPSAVRSLRLCRTRLPRLPELAGVKHLNRLPQVLARQEWPGPEPDEGLLLDADDSIVCGTMSNLFLRHGNRILTPPLEHSGVAGVVRERLLTGRIPGMEILKTTVTTAQIGVDTLLAADEVWLTNAVVGIWPVASLKDSEGRELAGWEAPGPVTTALAVGLVRLLESA